MAKRRASAFAMRVGAGIKRGLTFKQAVQAAKGSKSSAKLKSTHSHRSGAITMPHRKSHRKRPFSRRGTSRKPGITPWRVLKAAIIFGPPVAKAASDYKTAGGGMSGVSQGVIPSLTTSYTGYNPNDGHFYPTNLVVGWAGPIAALVLSKSGLSKLFKV